MRYDYEIADNGNLMHAGPPGPEWMRRRLGVDFFDDVLHVSLSLPRPGDLSPLADLPSLEFLSLYATQVSDLSPLVRLTRLETLGLSVTPVWLRQRIGLDYFADVVEVDLLAATEPRVPEPAHFKFEPSGQLSLQMQSQIEIPRSKVGSSQG